MRISALAITIVPVLALGVPGLANLPTKLVYNGSKSSRVGFYWIDNQPAELGDFVLMEVPNSMRKLIESRRYLPPNVPLIKRIVAVEGDEVCRKRSNILVNGSGMGVAKPEDILGRHLPVWKGCEVLTKEQIFVLQFHPDSFDGRYFGPVNRDLIIGRATWLSLPWAN